MNEIIKDFTNKYGSFLYNGVFYLRGWIDGSSLNLMRDWFNVPNRKLYFAHIANPSVSENKLTFEYTTYEGKKRNAKTVTIVGYDPACTINDKIFSFKNIPYFEVIIKSADWLVDEELSGAKDGVIYCVLDLFKLGRLNFNEQLRFKGEGLFSYFERELKSGKLHIPQYDDTLTVYRACKESNPEIYWYGLWSMTKQEPLNRIDFSEKFFENFSEKVLTNLRE